MDWKSLGDELAQTGLPLLGGALGGPAGAFVGKLLGSAIGAPGQKADPKQLLSLITGNAEAMAKAKEFEQTHQEAMLKLSLDAETARIESVNKTLQTEAMGGSYWQKNHHAFECSFAVLLVGMIYFLMPMCHVTPPQVPYEAWMMIGAVLGVTAWKRESANVAIASSQQPPAPVETAVPVKP